MGNVTNAIGRFAILGALIISALMIVYFIVSGDGKVAFGIAITSWAIAAFIYLFYARLNTVQRTGYMSLLFVIFLAFLLPFFVLAQPKVSADSTQEQYNTRLHYAAGLYTTYCSQCHGLFGQGLQGPQLNNGLAQRPNGNPNLDKLTTQDIQRIITGGIVDSSNPTFTSYLMPQWGQQYGGPFNEDDVNSLVSLIMSSDPTLQAKAFAPLPYNGFSYVQQYVITPAQQEEYQKELAALSRPPGQAVDLTSQKAVTIDMTTSDTGAFVFQYTDAQGNTYNKVKIKAGTKITWVNKSQVPHSVTSGDPTTGKNNAFPSADLVPTGPTGTYSYTFTTAGTYPYYCTFHAPGMVGEIDVVP